jgi:glycosidase
MAADTSVQPKDEAAVDDSAPWVIGDRAGRIGIELDRETGLAIALLTEWTPGQLERMPLCLTATLVTEGDEVDGQPFGLAYAETVDLSTFSLASPEVRYEQAGYDDIFTVETRVGDWRVDWEYRFRGSTPRIELQVILGPTGDRPRSTLRNLHIDLAFRPDDLDGWIVQAPGSPIRTGIPAGLLADGSNVSESCFSGSGVVVLEQPARSRALLVWPFSRTEQSRNQVQSADGSLLVSVTTGLAGRIGSHERLRWGAIQLDAFAATWDELRPTAHTWFATLGTATPADTAGWIPGASIFEVQIGTSIFWNGYEYSPYPTARDLLDDLGRIAGLGFDCVQIMPRQPFPSYNVYDYADISVSYGDEADLRAIVQAAHALGMKVILDILMHGVIDAEIIGQAADRVRNGPLFARLDEGTDIVPDPGFTAYEELDYSDYIGWSRHILDFEPYWAAGSPGTHPLVEEHPEWFVRRSNGEIIGVYTKAFDVSNLAWQEYFTDAALNLVRRLDIDGFRFDAPTYNEVPNWSPATETRASAQQLGSVDYFARLRPQLKALKPAAMLYTEPSGTLFRETMDITYNYDEHWLIHALLRPDSALAANPLGIRHARDLALWLRDKEALLPRGAMTARHIDSHDTFWWPLPGFKWRREQYGLPATRALVATWALIGGVYMTFVGGETHLESDIRRINRLRHEIPEIRLGTADYDAVQADDDRVFAVARILDGRATLVLVNASPHPLKATVAIDHALRGPAERAFQVVDLWQDDRLAHGSTFAWSAADLESFPLAFDAYGIHVLRLQPVSA